MKEQIVKTLVENGMSQEEAESRASEIIRRAKLHFKVNNNHQPYRESIPNSKSIISIYQ